MSIRLPARLELGRDAMRFMVMHKMTAEMERGLPPDPAIIEGVELRETAER
jgi:hypothetical protein